MAYVDDEDYTFPDEMPEIEVDDGEFEIEIEDDTPVADRGKTPLPKAIVEELEEADDSDEYTGKVQTKFKQYKKAWHDERRAKEEAFREQEEALSIAQRTLDENKRLKALLESGEKELISTYQTSAELEVEQAKRNYKEAYDFGNTDAIIEAQAELMKATNKLDKANSFRPTIQNVDDNVQVLPKKQPQAAQIDPKVAEWVAENPWYVDPTKKAMSRYAKGIHEDLANAYGEQFVGSDEYYKRINQEIRHRFPEEFETNNDEPKTQRTPKLSTVVASAKRSTSSKKITLTTTQLALAKKFGLTPEQYAREQSKLEA
jgi:hypothetical protein